MVRIWRSFGAREREREGLWRWIRWLAALRAGLYPGRLVLLGSQLTLESDLLPKRPKRKRQYTKKKRRQGKTVGNK